MFQINTVSILSEKATVAVVRYDEHETRVGRQTPSIVSSNDRRLLL